MIGSIYRGWARSSATQVPSRLCLRRRCHCAHKGVRRMLRSDGAHHVCVGPNLDVLIRCILQHSFAQGLLRSCNSCLPHGRAGCRHLLPKGRAHQMPHQAARVASHLPSVVVDAGVRAFFGGGIKRQQQRHGRARPAVHLPRPAAAAGVTAQRGDVVPPERWRV